MKDIKEMSIEELRNESGDLYERLYMVKQVGTYDRFNWNGLDYWDADRRYYKICQEIISRNIGLLNDITVEELQNDNGKSVSILTYKGEGDPVEKLDNKIKEYVGNKKYIEFIDSNMDNPWVRVIVFNS